MSDTLAEEIRAAREARGWDQAELGRTLGVGQQTVSRWERGQTAPGEALLGQLRAILGLDSAGTSPRRPLLEELPFNRLDAYQFEAFCDALASRVFPDAQEVMRYGVSGDTQHGIDVRVVTADGERIGIQCKKYAKFQPSSFEKAVAELDRARARVDRCILFLSTKAGAKVLKACDGRAEWTIWDSRTLSRKVHELPGDQALSLVDRFFPDMREEFLGVRTPSVWRTSAEAFPASVHSPVFSHEFQLVGRRDTLDEMLAFAVGGEDASRVAVLTGTAGLGKSRLLYELAREHDRRGATTRILLPGPITPEAFEYLPTSGPLLVLVDDAHERSEDLGLVVTSVLRKRPDARVVLATRPYGRHVVQQALRASGVDDRDVPRWALTALKPAEAYALASDILGERQEHAAQALAHVAPDSPLLLVNAATATKRGDLTVGALESDENLHQLLLDVFVQSALTQSTQPDTDRALLHAVATLQPVATNVPHFQKALSAILQMPFTHIGPQLRRLEGTGIVVRRGASVRISPDLLGDVLLAEAAVHSHTRSSTGYLERVRDCTEGDALANALINAGRVDWQWNGRLPHRKGIVDPLWAVLETNFKDGDASTRAELLRLIRRIAPFQPQRAFDLAQWALDHPTDGEDDTPSQTPWPLWQFGAADIRREVPRVLEAVAVDLDQLRSVYDLLWHLGQDDERPLNQHPDSPLRILLNLASYAPHKPVAYQEILLDALSDWLEEGTPNPGNRMPVALLDPLFSNTAESRTMEGPTLTIGRHPVRAEAVASVRGRAIGILLNQYAADDEVRAVAAAATIAEVLRFQTQAFEPYNVEFLQMLAERTREVRPGPLVSLAVQRSVRWAVNHGSPAIRSAAAAVVDALPDSTEHRLALMLHTGAFDVRFAPRPGDESAEAAWAALRRDTFSELARRSADMVAACLVSLVESGHKVRADHAAGVHVVVTEALKERPDLTHALIERLSTTEDMIVQLMLPTVLHAWIGQDAARALDACHRMVTEGRHAHIQAVAQALPESIQDVSVQEAGALDLARRLADNPDSAVRAGVINMAVSMLRSSREAALGLLTSVRFGDMEMELHHLWWAFTTDRLLSWSDLTAEQRKHFLDELTALRTLDDHTVQQFIAHVASFDEPGAVSFLQGRVKCWETDQADSDFNPLPHQWSAPLPFDGSPSRMDLLRSVQEWLAEPREETWRRERHATDLFWTIAGRADDAVLGLLLEPYRTDDADLAHAAASLLSKIPRDTVWTRVEFVTELLKAAARLSNELFRRTAGNLRSAVLSGVRLGTPGQPFQEDIDIRDRAQRIRAGLPRGSAVDLFYKALQDNAEREMEWAITKDLDDD